MGYNVISLLLEQSVVDRVLDLSTWVRVQILLVKFTPLQVKVAQSKCYSSKSNKVLAFKYT